MSDIGVSPWSHLIQALTRLKHFFILLLMNNFDNHSALFYLPDTFQKVNNESCKKRSVLHLDMGILKKEKKNTNVTRNRHTKIPQ